MPSPFIDNYITINTCDATTGWVADGTNGQAVVTNNARNIEGTNCLELTSANGGGVTATWYLNITGTQRFKVTEEDCLMWFYYVKGKGAQYLTNAADAFVIRLYFGGTTKYADYWQGGNNDLPFGWDTYFASGKRSDATGGGHNLGTDWDLDIHRVEIRLEFQTLNNGANDAPLLMDWWRHGNTITCTSGSSGSPLSIQDVEDYNLSNIDGRPLGVVNVQDVFVDIRCGLTMGVSATPASAGWIQDSGFFFLFNQQSEEVKYNIIVNTNAGLQLGLLDVGFDGDYAVDGCQIVQPSGSNADVIVREGGTLLLYDCKLYRWRYVRLGENSNDQGNIEFRRVDVDTCETVYLNRERLDWTNVEVHDNAQKINNHSGEVLAEPRTFVNVSINNCKEGFQFKETVNVPEYLATDNDDADLSILEGKTATLVDSVFDENKIKRIT